MGPYLIIPRKYPALDMLHIDSLCTGDLIDLALVIPSCVVWAIRDLYASAYEM